MFCSLYYAERNLSSAVSPGGLCWKWLHLPPDTAEHVWEVAGSWQAKGARGRGPKKGVFVQVKLPDLTLVFPFVPSDTTASPVLLIPKEPQPVRNSNTEMWKTFLQTCAWVCSSPSNRKCVVKPLQETTSSLGGQAILSLFATSSLLKFRREQHSVYFVVVVCFVWAFFEAFVTFVLYNFCNLTTTSTYQQINQKMHACTKRDFSSLLSL